MQYIALPLSKQKRSTVCWYFFLVILLHFITLRDYTVSYKKYVLYACVQYRPAKKDEMLVLAIVKVKIKGTVQRIFSDGYVVREQISKRCREKYVSDSDLWMKGER